MNSLLILIICALGSIYGWHFQMPNWPTRSSYSTFWRRYSIPHVNYLFPSYMFPHLYSGPEIKSTNPYYFGIKHRPVVTQKVDVEPFEPNLIELRPELALGNRDVEPVEYDAIPQPMTPQKPNKNYYFRFFILHGKPQFIEIDEQSVPNLNANPEIPDVFLLKESAEPDPKVYVINHEPIKLLLLNEKYSSNIGNSQTISSDFRTKANKKSVNGQQKNNVRLNSNLPDESNNDQTTDSTTVQSTEKTSE